MYRMSRQCYVEGEIVLFSFTVNDPSDVIESQYVKHRQTSTLFDVQFVENTGSVTDGLRLQLRCTELGNWGK